MNRTKLLSIMPYILGILILALVAVIILTGTNDEDTNNDTTPTPATVAENKNNNDKTEPDKNDVKEPDNTDKGSDKTDDTKDNTDANTDDTPVTSEPEATPTPVPTPTTAPTPTPIADLTFGFKFESKADYVDTKDGVNLRLGCSTDTQKVAFLEEGKRLERTGYNDEWTRVIYDGQECYIATRLIIRAVDSIDAVVTPEEDNSDNDDDTMETADSGSIVFDKVSYYGAGAGKTVCIDPGHQGKGNSETEPMAPGSSTMKAKVSSGTSGVSTGINEYELDLAVSLLLKKELEARGYNVIMTRTTHDVNISNIERAQIANNAKADAFVRVHADSNTNSSINGITNYNMTADSPYNASLYKESRRLSECINVCAVNRTGANMRGVEDSVNYSGINWSEVPVTIIEMGFMSNPEEDKKLATDSYRLKMAVGIADGLDKYFAGE